LTLNEYQKLALRTANPGIKNGPPIQLNWALGLCGESGEAAEIVKKHFYHGHPVDYDELEEELGDAMYYLAVFANSFGFTLEEVALHNVEKLRNRYPDRFSEERSLRRDEKQGS